MANAGKAIYVRWLDSASVSGWQSESIGLSEIQSVGYLVREDGEHIEIALNRFDERGEFSGIFSIPKAVILERRVVKLTRKG